MPEIIVIFYMEVYYAISNFGRIQNSHKHPGAKRIQRVDGVEQNDSRKTIETLDG